jgi:hypothetical protein
VSERRVDGVLRWHGDHAARRAVYNNRARLLSGVARQAFRLRAEWVERSFALILDRGGMRRAWLRGRANIHKRYLIHVAGYNLGLIMRPHRSRNPARAPCPGFRQSVLHYPAGCCASRHHCVRRRAPHRCSRHHLQSRPVQLNTGFLNALLWVTSPQRAASGFHPERRRDCAEGRADRVAFRAPAKPLSACTPPFSAKAKVVARCCNPNQRRRTT